MKLKWTNQIGHTIHELAFFVLSLRNPYHQSHKNLSFADQWHMGQCQQHQIASISKDPSPLCFPSCCNRETKMASHVIPRCQSNPTYCAKSQRNLAEGKSSKSHPVYQLLMKGILAWLALYFTLITMQCSLNSRKVHIGQKGEREQEMIGWEATSIKDYLSIALAHTFTLLVLD